MGAREAAIEFCTQEEMFQFLSNEGELGKIFTVMKPATPFDKPTRYFTWIRIWHTPLGLWNRDFFALLAGHVGEFVCVDEATENRAKFDYARMVVSTPTPFVERRKVDIQVEDQSITVMMEGEDTREIEDQLIQAIWGMDISSTGMNDSPRASEGTVVEESEDAKEDENASSEVLETGTPPCQEVGVNEATNMMCRVASERVRTNEDILGDFFENSKKETFSHWCIF